MKWQLVIIVLLERAQERAELVFTLRPGTLDGLVIHGKPLTVLAFYTCLTCLKTPMELTLGEVVSSLINAKETFDFQTKVLDSMWPLFILNSNMSAVQ